MFAARRTAAGLVARRLAPAQPVTRACARRTFAEEASSSSSAPATTSGSSAAPPTSARVQVPVPTAAKRRSPFFDRLGAFVAGTAVALCVGYWKLHADVWDSTMQVEESIASMKKDVVESNADLRRRIARLEHDVAYVKDKQTAKGM